MDLTLFQQGRSTTSGIASLAEEDGATRQTQKSHIAQLNTVPPSKTIRNIFVPRTIAQWNNLGEETINPSVTPFFQHKVSQVDLEGTQAHLYLNIYPRLYASLQIAGCSTALEGDFEESKFKRYSNLLQIQNLMLFFLIHICLNLVIIMMDVTYSQEHKMHTKLFLL